MSHRIAACLIASAVIIACSSSETTTSNSSSGSPASTAASSSSTGESATGGAGGTGGGGGGGGATPIGGDRPVTVFVPSTYDPKTPMPLVLLLHGYSASGAIQEAYMQFQPLAESRGFLYAHPDGTKDKSNLEFWNATDACCNFNGSMVDDSTYLESVVDEIKQRFNVDPKRVYLIGHSNGGFMSYRMACDHAGTYAAIAVLAGEMWEDASKCMAASPVSVLHIQGTADTTIGYNGGSNFGNMYPSAMTSVEDWVTIDGCTDSPTVGTPLDLDTGLPGDETDVKIWSSGCKPGGAVELWTINGGGHIPALAAQTPGGPVSEFSPSVIDFLFAHPKP